MRGVADVEAYLGKMRRSFVPVDGQPGTYLVSQPDASTMPPTVVRVDPPLCVLRTRVGAIPPGDPAPFFRKLLTLNATTQVHTHFGLESEQVVLTSALELENLDYNELEATLDEIDLTVAEQVPKLVPRTKT